MLTLIIPKNSYNLKPYVTELLANKEYDWIESPANVTKEKTEALDRIIFAIELDQFGQNQAVWDIIKEILSANKNPFENTTAMVIVKSFNELFTKTFASLLVFNLNQMGCRFMGSSLMEMTYNLKNLNRWEKTTGTDRDTLVYELGKEKLEQFLKYEPPKFQNPRMSVLHASHRDTSNTLLLWKMIEEHLTDINLEELHVENGTVVDCSGCYYQTCKYYGEQGSCFYGSNIVKEVFTAIEKSDAILWVCPNYNDSVSANLMAVINRLTALRHTISFLDKEIFAVIVSGNSGSDTVARQLIGALNFNKGFQLPPYFSIMATAYDPGSIWGEYNIEDRAKKYASHLRQELITDCNNVEK